MSAEQDDTAVTDADGPDEGRVSRRTAMKVAIGGATAAAVWSAPRIEGLSLAPDYAQAASCSASSGGIITFNSNNCGYYGDTECWGNNCCGTKGYGNVTIGSRFNFAGNYGGDVSGDNGFINVTINNLDPPFQHCTVNVSGNCNNGATFRNNNVNLVFNNNGTQSSLLDCQGGGSFVQSDADGTVRVNVSCNCD